MVTLFRQLERCKLYFSTVLIKKECLLNCHCGSGKGFKDCCGVFLDYEQKPSSAEQLMRSRYSAFVVGAIDYIYDTHAPETQSEVSKDEIMSWSQTSEWMGMKSWILKLARRMIPMGLSSLSPSIKQMVNCTRIMKGRPLGKLKGIGSFLTEELFETIILMK